MKDDVTYGAALSFFRFWLNVLVQDHWQRLQVPVHLLSYHINRRLVYSLVLSELELIRGVRLNE